MADAEPYVPPADGATKAAPAVTDDQIKAMAAKSGDTEDHIRDMLNLNAKGPEAVAKEKLAGKFTDDAALNTGIDNITTKLNVPKDKAESLIKALGPEEAYKYWQTQLSKNGSSDKDASSEGSDKDALSGDQDADANADGKKEGDAQSDNTGKIDINKYSTEYAEKGELSADTYKELADKGIPKEFVDAYITGMEAQGKLYTQSVTQMAGGETQYNAMVTWAADNLSQPEKDRFNSALDSGDTGQVQPLIEALRARYERAEGTHTRKTVEGSEAKGGSNVQGYESAQQMTADMRDPRYLAGDPAFHAYVRNRIKFSKAL